MTFKIIRPQTIAQTSEFSRASTATYWDADGVLQTAAIDVPRFTYDPSDLSLPPGPLIEGAATNYLLWAEDFSNAAWIKTACTISSNVELAPDGSSNADKMVEGASTGIHFLRQSFSVPDLIGTYSDPVFVKAGERNLILLAINDGSTFYGAGINLTDGTLFNVPVDASISTDLSAFEIFSLPNGWWKVISTRAQVSTTTRQMRFYTLNSSGNANYTGDGVSGFYLFGGECKRDKSSYIKTDGTAASRAADIPGDMLTSSIAEDDYAEYNAGTTYALADRVISTTTHRIYESLQAGNLGNPLPAADEVSTEWWLNVSATNRWKMFDNSVTSQSSATDLIATVIETVGRVDSIALLNTSGRSVRIVMVDDTEGEVYDQNYSLIDDSGITDWYEYFFEPVTSIPNFSVQDLPLYANTQIQVTVENIGGTVLIGALVVGLSRSFGDTEIGAGLGIQDYSVKITDDFGNRTVLERAFNDIMELQVLVENANLDALKTLLAGFRATPIVYVGSVTYGSMIIFGFFRDFRFVIAYPTHSVLNIEIEGLT